MPPNHRTGRQSLPPMSNAPGLGMSPKSAPLGLRAGAPLSAVSASSSAGGGAGAGGDTRARSPLVSSLSVGNLRGLSEGARGAGGAKDGATTSASGAPASASASGSGSGSGAGGGPGVAVVQKKEKPKKKKGMKGWAWVIEDENGNVIDAPEEETPQASKAGKGAGEAGVAVLVTPPEEERRSKRVAHSPRSRASTIARDEQVLGKRAHHKSSSPAVSDRFERVHAPLPTPATASNTTASKPPSTSDEHRRKIPRRSSPLQPTVATPPATATSAAAALAAPPPERAAALAATAANKPAPRRSNGNAGATPAGSSTANAGPAGRASTPTTSATSARAPPGGAAARSRALAARERESGAASRAGSAHVVDDDSPLVAPPPRAGMGEGEENPRQSAVREAETLREEAMVIIEANRRKQEMLERQGGQGGKGGRALRPRRENGRMDVDGDGDGESEDDDEDVESEVELLPPLRRGPRANARARASGPFTTTAPAPADPYAHSPSPAHTTRAPASAQPSNYPPDSFESQFEQIQAYYRERAAVAAARAAAESDAQDGRKERERVVVLASNGVAVASRDRGEKVYQEGQEGLTPDMEADAQGFVKNVRANLSAIATYYFPQRTPRRDAFMERIGRGLQKLGMELTDTGDVVMAAGPGPGAPGQVPVQVAVPAPGPAPRMGPNGPNGPNGQGA
ncbi:hypothetical protein IAT38_008076 [Cryptococcus sp. DSM 104549]